MVIRSGDVLYSATTASTAQGVSDQQLGQPITKCLCRPLAKDKSGFLERPLSEAAFQKDVANHVIGCTSLQQVSPAMPICTVAAVDRCSSWHLMSQEAVHTRAYWHRSKPPASKLST